MQDQSSRAYGSNCFPMNFLELTSYVGGRQGYADEPTFNGLIWPLLLLHRTLIARVFLFNHESSRIDVARFPKSEAITSNIASIGSLAKLTNDQLKMIANRSFSAGHLNVLYQICDNSLLRKLIASYP